MRYDFDIKANAVELLPPDKRKVSNIRLIWSLLSPLQWVRDLLFGSYFEGATAPGYVPGTVAYLSQVIYDRKVYMSLIDGNTDLPTASTWTLVQNNFIGVKERILYNASKLVFEYALNKEYGTTFRQPTAISDIFITKLSAQQYGFLVGETEPYCSSVGQFTASEAIGGSWTAVYLNHFQINVPAALLSSVTIGHIRDYANQYVPASLKFTIVSY
jgi:hypothetical protein